MNSQTAITLLKNLEQSLDDYCELNDEGKTAFSMAISALELFGISEQLPSVQPELSNNSPELDIKNGELISRQAAIDAVHEEFDECLVWDESGLSHMAHLATNVAFLCEMEVIDEEIENFPEEMRGLTLWGGD